MKQLIFGTAAYKTFANDAQSGRLSHAYMLHFNDAKNLRLALKIFATRFFGLDGEEVDGKRLMNETLTDCRIYPEEGKKLTADAVSELLADSALQPLERENKLYIISGFNEASALLQNKLLKTLEEPPRGVYFLLGATTLAPVLDTVKSRVKTLQKVAAVFSDKPKIWSAAVGLKKFYPPRAKFALLPISAASERLP